jgi:hypothetical protein
MPLLTPPSPSIQVRSVLVPAAPHGDRSIHVVVVAGERFIRI